MDLSKRSTQINNSNTLGTLDCVSRQQNLQPTCNQLVTDTISRQAAIDALHMHLMYRMGTDSNKKRLDEWINNLPSAQPKRKTGYKINQHQYPAKWVCSECGAKHFDFSDNFCSQCGADVRGDKDGTD